MPVPSGVTIDERSNSRSGEYLTSATREYFVKDAADESEVEAAVLATVPTTHNGLVFDGFSYSTVDDDERLYYVQVKYRPARSLISPPEAGTARFFWSVAGESSSPSMPGSRSTCESS